METVETAKKRPKTGGRAKGTPNRDRASLEKKIDRACRRWGLDLVGGLVETAKNAKDEKNRTNALIALWNWRYGKPREKLELSGELGHYDAVAKSRARVLAFEKQKATLPAQPAVIETPAVAPSFAAWKSENGLETATQEPAAPESEDVERGKIRRVVMQ